MAWVIVAPMGCSVRLEGLGKAAREVRGSLIAPTRSETSTVHLYRDSSHFPGHYWTILTRHLDRKEF
jgi:hypothetical protein